MSRGLAPAIRRGSAAEPHGRSVFHRRQAGRVAAFDIPSLAAADRLVVNERLLRGESFLRFHGTGLDSMAANPQSLPPDDDSAWASYKAEWDIRPDTIYLNHGSYGPSPNRVREARRELLRRLDDQPMDFFMRR